MGDTQIHSEFATATPASARGGASGHCETPLHEWLGSGSWCIVESRCKKEGQIMKVAIVVFDGVQALDVAGPMDVFAEANNLLAPEQQYQVTLVGMHPGGVRCANGLELKVETDYLSYHDQPDLLLVAGGPKLPEMRPAPSFLQWLSAKAAGSRRFGSVCNGAFPLGHAGLLNGKNVTAHWHHVDRLAAQFPRARVRPDKIFVRDGSLFTCAGVTAGVDLCLALVTEDWGHDMALRIAKQLIVYIRRDGGQSQYSPYLAVGPKEETIVAKVLRYVTDHISEQLSIEQLADAVAVSRRTFSRMFAKDASMTPSAFVEQIRVDFLAQAAGGNRPAAEDGGVSMRVPQRQSHAGHLCAAARHDATRIPPALPEQRDGRAAGRGARPVDGRRGAGCAGCPSDAGSASVAAGRARVPAGTLAAGPVRPPRGGRARRAFRRQRSVPIDTRKR
jgi:transcriptional regulator GlxA family with amidase domain